jgi:hypothetical protein
VCWDIASDEVGVVASIWIPIAIICYPVLLWTVEIIVRSYTPLPPSGEEQCNSEEEGDVHGPNVAATAPHKDVEMAAPTPAPTPSLSPPPQDTEDANSNPMHSPSY